MGARDNTDNTDLTTRPQDNEGHTRYTEFADKRVWGL